MSLLLGASRSSRGRSEFTCCPEGVVSVISPSLPLTVRIFPLGAMAKPSGAFRNSPVDTVDPVPSEVVRRRALGMAATRSAIVSAT